MKRRFALLLTLGVLLGGCGQPGSDGGESALQLITAAATNTNEAGTARVTMDMSMSMAGQSIDMTASGAMDLDTRMAHMTMTMTSDDSPGLSDMGDIEVVMDGFKGYYKYPPEMAASMPGNKPWVLIDMQAVGESQGMDYAALAQAGGSDPTQIIQYLNGVAGDVETVGEEEIHGVKTTHYRATIDLDKAADQAPEDIQEAVRTSIGAMKKQLGEVELPIEVWVGEDDLVHRMSMHMASDSGELGEFEMDMTIDMFDFGQPVDVSIPDRSQVYDMTQSLIDMGSGTKTSP